jgi:hypothetical protein
MERRKLLIGAITGSAALLFPRLSIAAPMQESNPSQNGGVSSYVSLSLPGSDDFQTKLAILFPGLLNDSFFRKIMSHCVMIANLSSQDISAFSTHWQITTAGAGYERTILHYFHPTTKHPTTVHFGIKGNRTRYTGAVPVLRAGETRLLSPYFNWSPHYWHTHPTPNWKKILQAKETLNKLSYSASNKAEGIA